MVGDKYWESNSPQLQDPDREAGEQQRPTIQRFQDVGEELAEGSDEVQALRQSGVSL